MVLYLIGCYGQNHSEVGKKYRVAEKFGGNLAEGDNESEIDEAE